MLSYLLFLPQIALIALYDWIFFVNEYTAFPANCWWAFSFLHATLLVEFVSVYLLRHMKQMPFTQKHPMWLFSIVFSIQFLFSVFFSLVSFINLKWSIIFSSVVLIAETFSFVVLLIVQKYREKKNTAENIAEYEAEEGVEVEEILPLPQKIQSTAMLLLMRFLADPRSWNVPKEFNEIYELADIVSYLTQYTYKELSVIESELKRQTDALKTYINNRSFNRAKKTIDIIADILLEREEQIKEIEKR